MVDIPGVIQSIRQQRMKMVQTVVCKDFAVALNELEFDSSYNRLKFNIKFSALYLSMLFFILILT